MALSKTQLRLVIDLPPGFFYNRRKDIRNLRARFTGEIRHPKKGEYYLSGAIIEAYRAPNDLNWDHHIAEIVLIETITHENIIEIVDLRLDN